MMKSDFSILKKKKKEEEIVQTLQIFPVVSF